MISLFMLINYFKSSSEAGSYISSMKRWDLFLMIVLFPLFQCAAIRGVAAFQVVVSLISALLVYIFLGVLVSVYQDGDTLKFSFFFIWTIIQIIYTLDFAQKSAFALKGKINQITKYKRE